MKVRFLFLFFLVIFSWLFKRIWDNRIHERISAFCSKPVNGKSWQTEYDKFVNLYPKTNRKFILFVGDSHIEQCEWHELFPDFAIKNRGIGGEQTTGLLLRIEGELEDSVLVFLQIGINDLMNDVPVDSVLANHQRILRIIKNKNAVLHPCQIFYTRYQPKINDRVFELNEKLIRFYSKEGIKCIDINPIISEDHRLLSRYSDDGIHLNAEGYSKFKEAISPYLAHVNDSQLRSQIIGGTSH